MSKGISRDSLGNHFVADEDIRTLKLIYVAASGLERGFQSRSQKKAFICDTFGAGEGSRHHERSFFTKSVRAVLGSILDAIWASFWEPKSQLSALEACRSKSKQGHLLEAIEPRNTIS